MKKGFTIIELLVVVLIIGVLSAIALPQYQKAVKRAKGAEALTVMKATVDAVNAYYLANGSYPFMDNENPTELSPDLPKMKHWQYAQVGSVPTISGKSDDFYGCYDVSGSSNFCSIRFLDTENEVRLQAFLQYGRVSSYNCSAMGNSAENAKCEKYFPCKTPCTSQGGSTQCNPCALN